MLLENSQQIPTQFSEMLEGVGKKKKSDKWNTFAPPRRIMNQLCSRTYNNPLELQVISKEFLHPYKIQ